MQSEAPCATSRRNAVVSDLCKSSPLVSGTDLYRLLNMLRQVGHIVHLDLESDQT